MRGSETTFSKIPASRDQERMLRRLIADVNLSDEDRGMIEQIMPLLVEEVTKDTPRDLEKNLRERIRQIFVLAKMSGVKHAMDVLHASKHGSAKP